jgi:hypothetical protein
MPFLRRLPLRDSLSRAGAHYIPPSVDLRNDHIAPAASPARCARSVVFWPASLYGHQTSTSARAGSRIQRLGDAGETPHALLPCSSDWRASGDSENTSRAATSSVRRVDVARVYPQNRGGDDRWIRRVDRAGIARAQ